MKYVVLFISLLSIFLCRGQEPDPDLFQTWYLQDMFLEFGPPLELLDPPVYPVLTIAEDLSFNGQGSCNTFEGTYMYNPSEDIMVYIDFTDTDIDCVFPYHNQFEDQYFNAVRGMWYYEITEDGTGQQLYIFDLFELSATFTNYSLSTTDFDIELVKVYPNPGSSVIRISSQKEPLTHIELYDLFGKRIPITSDLKEVDISSLASGTYILKLYSERGSAVKRIIKE